MLWPRHHEREPGPSGRRRRRNDARSKDDGDRHVLRRRTSTTPFMLGAEGTGRPAPGHPVPSVPRDRAIGAGRGSPAPQHSQRMLTDGHRRPCPRDPQCAALAQFRTRSHRHYGPTAHGSTAAATARSRVSPNPHRLGRPPGGHLSPRRTSAERCYCRSPSPSSCPCSR
jgi:hypothetical protein